MAAFVALKNYSLLLPNIFDSLPRQFFDITFLDGHVMFLINVSLNREKKQ